MSIDHTHGGLDLLAALYESGLEVGVTGCPGCRADRLARRGAVPVPEPPTALFPAPSGEIMAWPAHDASAWEWADDARTWDRIVSASWGPFTVTQSESFDGETIAYGLPELEVDRADAYRLDDGEAITDLFGQLRDDLAMAEVSAHNALVVAETGAPIR